MKVAFFSKIPVFPAHGGNRARIHSFCERLIGSGCEVDFYLIPSRQMQDFDRDEHARFFGRDHVIILHRSRVQALLFSLKAAFWLLWGRMREAVGVHRKQANVDYLFPGGLERRIRSVAARRAYDICIVSYVHFSKIFDVFGADTLKVLDTHDSFSNEFTAEAEAKGFRRADVILAIQDDEAALFRRQLGAEAHRVRVLSHLIAPRRLAGAVEGQGATFIGSAFEANIVSLRYFVDEVLPLVLRRLDGFRLFVAGTVCDTVADHPNIVKLGRVKTVADAFAGAPVLINPIRAGTGVKIKLLDAMSLGVPTVSTLSGVRGVEPRYLAGVVRVADDDAAAFAEAVVRLSTDGEERARLGAAAFACGQDWAARQDAHIAELLAHARQRSAPAEADRNPEA